MPAQAGLLSHGAPRDPTCSPAISCRGPALASTPAGARIALCRTISGAGAVFALTMEIMVVYNTTFAPLLAFDECRRQPGCRSGFADARRQNARRGG
jgi:hypothetical protein